MSGADNNNEFEPDVVEEKTAAPAAAPEDEFEDDFEDASPPTSPKVEAAATLPLDADEPAAATNAAAEEVPVAAPAAAAEEVAAAPAADEPAAATNAPAEEVASAQTGEVPPLQEAAPAQTGEVPPLAGREAPRAQIDEGEDSRPAFEIDNAGEGDALDQAIQDDLRNTNGSNSPARSKSGGQLNQSAPKDHDLKARTMFSQSTQDGVLKRTTFIHKLSTYHSAPQITIASRGEGMFQRSTQGPAPGSYNLPHEEKSRFRTSARFSFGGSSRFGLGGSPTKLQPGPGAYNAKDPSLYVDTKVGFGTSVRNKGQPASQAAPGPGAYECRSTVGGGLMFTARGRHPTSYMRSRSLPGPGTYAPTLNGAYQASPKCGFGTSTRAEFGGGSSRGQPGPGTYEMQNFKCVGKDSKKFSATSRRRVHDLSSYVTPGPGTYNAHATSFGAPGAPSCSHVDQGYITRNAPAVE